MKNTLLDTAGHDRREKEGKDADIKIPVKNMNKFDFHDVLSNKVKKLFSGFKYFLSLQIM